MKAQDEVPLVYCEWVMTVCCPIFKAQSSMYNEHFGFDESPFNVTPDLRFFYSNRLYQEAFTGLRWGIKLRQGLIVMTGEPGTG